MIIEVSNKSERVVPILLEECRPRDVKFVVQSHGRSVVRSNALFYGRDDFSESPADIRAGAVERYYFDLNRFANLTNSKQYVVNFTVRIRYFSEEDKKWRPKEAITNGSFLVNLIGADVSTLQKAWHELIANIGNSSCSEQLASAEAVCSIGDARAINYIEKLIKSDTYAVRLMCVNALGRFNTQEGNSVLQNLISAECEGGILEPALELLKRRNISLRADVLAKLLNHSSGRVRWLVLNYLKDGKYSEHLDVVNVLTLDKNAAVSNAARQLIESMR